MSNNDNEDAPSITDPEFFVHFTESLAASNPNLTEEQKQRLRMMGKRFRERGKKMLGDTEME